MRPTANDPATLSLITHPVLGLLEFTCCNLLPYCIVILRPCNNPRARLILYQSFVYASPGAASAQGESGVHIGYSTCSWLSTSANVSSAASGPAVEYLVICGEDDGSRVISRLQRTDRAQHLDYHDKRERPWRPGSAIADYRKDCRSAPRTIHTDLQRNSIHWIGARALHESESGVMSSRIVQRGVETLLQSTAHCAIS